MNGCIPKTTRRETAVLLIKRLTGKEGDTAKSRPQREEDLPAAGNVVWLGNGRYSGEEDRTATGSFVFNC
jgi:hypothetical protein